MEGTGDKGPRRVRRRDVLMPALAVSAAYAFLSVVWIELSDQAVLLATKDPQSMAMLSTLKGWAYVGVITVGLFIGVYVVLSRNLTISQELDERDADLGSTRDRLEATKALYAVSSGVARAVTQIEDRQLLLDEVCQVAVERGGFLMSWIGLVTEDRKVVPVARAGHVGDFLDDMDIDLAIPEKSRGPAGTAIRESRVYFSDDVSTDPQMSRRASKASAMGYRSAAAVPIVMDGRTIGAFSLESSQLAYFDDSQIALLEEIASELAYALGDLDAREQLKTSEEQLRSALHQLQTVFEVSPLPMILIGPDFSVALWNPAAERLFGWTAEEVIGRTNPIVPPELEHERVAARGRALSGEYVADWETVRMRKDGTLLDVSISVGGWRGADGEPAGTLLIVSDVTERKAAERRQRDTLARLETLVRTSPIAIAAVDTEMRTVLWNPAAERLFGWSAEEIIGKASPIESPDSDEDVPALRRDVLDGGLELAEVEVRRLRKDGTVVDLSFSTAALRDSEGVVLGSLAMWSDITERKSAQAEALRFNEELELRVEQRTSELSDANRKLEIATRAKSAFLATMSHELRTPLNSIIGFSAILREQMAGPLNEEQAKQLDIVYQSARHLLELINGVLSLSRVESGREETLVSDFDLDDAVAAEVERVRPLAVRKGVALELRPGGGGAAMRSDRTKLGQILLNLLSNAIKFTDAGLVEVTVETAGGSAKITVRDTGRGIAPGDMERIFEDFYQAASSPEDQGGGPGLGLPLSRRLAQLLRGTITVSSVPGEGSEFILTIPLDLPKMRYK